MILLSRLLLALGLPVLLVACREEKKPSDTKAAIQQEVEGRLAEERRAFDQRGNSLRTIRIIGFALLTGGAMWMLWKSQPLHGRATLPQDSTEGHHPRWLGNRRVIDMPSSNRQPPP